LRSKSAQLSNADIRWHLVGHLQTNKVRRTLPIAALIHSIDSEKLLDVVDREAALLGKRVSVLLEVNVSGDATKHGFASGSLDQVIEHSTAWPSVSIQGLMCMAALEGGTSVARRNFAELREVRDRLARNSPPEASLQELSMGMSNDFEIAIEEGATIVRVGSALFEGLKQ
jgi:pyridoxal phosphate enzyme (YggS family)